MGAVEAMRLLARQNLSGDIQSGWDNCMQEDYCKWPAIVGIIIGSLIVLGIIGCLISCLCCGYTCCKGCCDCCCPSSRGRSSRPKHNNPPAPYNYQPPPPGPMQFPQASAPPAYRGPQIATFESVGPKVNEDSLPAMPTWADAATRRVEDHGPAEEVEMDRLDNPEHDAKQPLHPGGVSPILGTRPSRGGYQELHELPPSPHSPHPAYHEAPGDLHQQSYFPPAGAPLSPHEPSYGSGMALGASMGPTPLVAGGAAPASYRGFDIPQPRRTPNFNSPRPYDRGPSPTSPTLGQPQRSPYQTPVPFPSAPYGARSSPPQGQPPNHPPQIQHPPTPTYNAYSPPIPSSPPPPFSAGGQQVHELDDSELPANLQSGANRPPSLLQAGRKPVANSWRDI